MPSLWFSMNVAQLCPPETGPLADRMYLWIVRLLTRMPSFNTSPRIRSAPHRRFSAAISRINAIVFGSSLGLLDGAFDFLRHSPLNASRCHLRTVSGCMMYNTVAYVGDSFDNNTVRRRSRPPSFGRFAARLSTTT